MVKLYFKLPDGSVVSESDAPARLVEVLSAQLNTADDRVAAAAALVHTACAGSDAARLASCVSTLTKFVTNVKKDPAEPKYAVQLTFLRNNNTDSHHNTNPQSCGALDLCPHSISFQSGMHPSSHRASFN